MMNKKHVLNFIRIVVVLNIMGFLFVPGVGISATVFTQALDTLYTTFTNARVIVYATAGFGLIGVAVAAISGKLPWRWLAMISVALFTLAVAEKIVLYVTDTNLGSSPESDFGAEISASGFNIPAAGSDNFNFDNYSNTSTDNNFRSQLTQ